MPLARIRSRALLGIDSPLVEVEVHLANGLPAFHIVGLPEAAVRESRERVRAALLQGGYSFPNRRLTVNLAPADLPKDSGRFDLPIAIGVLVASGQVPADRTAARVFVGELSLSGELRPIRGALAMALAMAREPTTGDAAGAGRAPVLVLPAANAHEVALVPSLVAAPAPTFEAVCQDLRGDAPLAERIGGEVAGDADGRLPVTDDMADVRGQPIARRALEIAAAGAHSLLLVGPPGAGKSMLAQRLPGILPPLGDAEALETGAIASLAGSFDPECWRRRPFRAPHHTASTAALVGGGSRPRPGEISLAHHGVLFLDELPEFGARTLDSLREPLETGRVHIARANHRVSLPAGFQLVAAMNPCPCGHLGSERCRCTPQQVLNYQRRVSGPLLDRLDIHLWVAPVPAQTLLADPPGEPSASIADRVMAARTRQHERQGRPNAVMTPAEVRCACPMGADARDLLIHSAIRLQWSGRVMHRIVKLARTIADLAGESTLGPAAVSEAIGLRRALFEPGRT